MIPAMKTELAGAGRRDGEGSGHLGLTASLENEFLTPTISCRCTASPWVPAHILPGLVPSEMLNGVDVS